MWGGIQRGGGGGGGGGGDREVIFFGKPNINAERENPWFWIREKVKPCRKGKKLWDAKKGKPIHRGGVEILKR